MGYTKGFSRLFFGLYVHTLRPLSTGKSAEHCSGKGAANRSSNRVVWSVVRVVSSVVSTVVRITVVAVLGRYANDHCEPEQAAE